jgi:hypothetical protein
MAGGLGAIGVEQDLAQALVERDRRIGGGVYAAGDAGLDLPQGDLVADQDGGFQAGAAGLLHVVSRGFRGEAARQHALARQVEVARMLQHRAGGDFAEALAMQLITIHQAAQRGGEHVLVGLVRIGRVGAAEGDARAAEYGDLADGLGHAGFLAEAAECASFAAAPSRRHGCADRRACRTRQCCAAAIGVKWTSRSGVAATRAPIPPHNKVMASYRLWPE